MTALVSIGDVALFAGGFAVCWFFKDHLVKFFLGAKAFADKLDAKAKQIRDAL